MIRTRALALFLAFALVLGLSGTACASEEGAVSQEATAESEDELGLNELVDYVPADEASADPAPDSTAKAALLMDVATGTVLWRENEQEQLEPASVTKVMTLLLVCEAIDAGSLTTDQIVTASAHAASMGGSQVYLEEGEQMTVDELLKAVVVSSGNDAAVALGEAVSGSESAFVERMNARAAELGLQNTHFVNCTGLPAAGHVTCAADLAIISQQLLRHTLIHDYTGIWMDSLRGGAFGLSSTNKLLRTYDGCTGLKTGFTATAGYCISASASRDGMELVAVVLGCKTSADRFSTAATLLDWGFANFKTVTLTPDEPLPDLPVTLGEAETVSLHDVSTTLLLRAADVGSVTTRILLPDSVAAPAVAGDRAGTFLVQVGDRNAAVVPITLAQDVPKLSLSRVLVKFAKNLTAGVR